MSVTLQDILEDLNYLMGDTGVPSTGIDNQKRFIQRTVEKIYDSHDFSWSYGATNYQFSGATQILPSDFEHMIRLTETITGSDNDNVYTETTFADKDKNDSEFLFWVTGNQVDGYVLNINQTDNPLLATTYKKRADTLSAITDQTRIPSSMAIARGALAFMQEAEDPYRDTSDAWSKFQRELDDLVKNDTRGRPPKKFFTLYDRYNIRLGEPR